jgi:hypothetical protein
LASICIGLFALWLLTYFHNHSWDDERYSIKQEAWLWLEKQTQKKNLKILERFPIVTYYSGTWKRFITPYTDSLKDLLTYAEYNDIDYLIVDTLDFAKYRPDLLFLLDESRNIPRLTRVKVFTKKYLWTLQKVIIYKVRKKRAS